MGQTVAVLAGGEILDDSKAKELLAGATVICADSGYHHAQRLGITPALLVGDFDSIAHIPEHIPRVSLSVDKNYTDSVHAVEEALRFAPKEILLLGMLGGRLDHSLSNLALLMGLAEKGYRVTLTDGLTFVYPLVAKGRELTKVSFPPLENHYFSLLCYSDRCEQVSILGGKYPLDNYPLTNRDPRAISNEFIGVPVTLQFSSGQLLFITTPQKIED